MRSRQWVAKGRGVVRERMGWQFGEGVTRGIKVANNRRRDERIIFFDVDVC